MNDATAVSVIERAALALNSPEHERRLTELAKASTAIVAITNKAGYDELHAARMALKNVRVTIEKTGKAVREDSTAFNKAVIAEEKRLIGIVLPEETRLGAIQQEADTRAEREREAKVLAEVARTTELNRRLACIREYGGSLLTMSSSALRQCDESLAAVPVDESWQEFQQQAFDAKTARLVAISQALDAAVQREKDAAELAELRAAQAKSREEEERRASQERARAAEAEAATRAREQAEAQEREALAAAEREKQRKESERIAAENRKLQQERDAALQREAKAKAEQERKDRAAAVAKKAEDDRLAEIARKAAVRRPSDKALLDVVTNHFQCDRAKAHEWLVSYGQRDQ